MREDRPSATAGLIAWATAAQARLPELAPLAPAGAAEACGWVIEALRPGVAERLPLDVSTRPSPVLSLE